MRRICLAATLSGSMALGSGAFRRHVATSDPLAELLAQLQHVDTKAKKRTSGEKKESSGPPVSPKIVASEPTNSSPQIVLDEPHSDVASRMQLAVDDHEDYSFGGSSSAPQAKLPDKESKPANMLETKANTISECKTSLSAFPTLTSSEMLQEGSVQHFTQEPEPVSRPLLPYNGTIALAEIVGKVVSLPELKEDSNGNGVYAEIIAEYAVPVGSEPSSFPTVTLEVRAYGSTLSSFAIKCVTLGDIIHASGHLFPVEKSGMCVAVLPMGGDLNVVFRDNKPTS